MVVKIFLISLIALSTYIIGRLITESILPSNYWFWGGWIAGTIYMFLINIFLIQE